METAPHTCSRLEQTRRMDPQQGEVQTADVSVMGPLLRFRWGVCMGYSLTEGFKPWRDYKEILESISVASE